MRIGLCTVKLEIVDSFSLKDKRSVLLSLFSKLRANFNISVAEVERLNSFKHGEIAFVSINTESSHLHSTLSSIIGFIESDFRVRIEDYKIEII